MLMRTDPFRDLDKLADQLWGGSRKAPMPMDAYRRGDDFVVHFDLPGVEPDSIEVTVEKNVLTVSARRYWDRGDELQVVASERPQGQFSRQLFLGEGLDTDGVVATYDHGVLTIQLPVAEQAKPRRVSVSAPNGSKPIETSASG